MATTGGNGNRKKRKRPTPPGQGTKCTKERTKAIAALVASGVSQIAACECCDTHENTFWLWMKKGREGTAPCYVNFYKAITKARAVWQAGAERLLMEAGQKRDDPRPIMFMLERRCDEYKPPEKRLRHAGDAANPLVITHIKVPQFAEELTDGDGGADS